MEVHTENHEVVIALGSNVGDRLHNFNEACQLMKNLDMHIIRHACLYETEPAWLLVSRISLYSLTLLLEMLQPGPHELFDKDLGKTDEIRYGPRPMDLDILF